LKIVLQFIGRTDFNNKYDSYNWIIYDDFLAYFPFKSFEFR